MLETQWYTIVIVGNAVVVAVILFYVVRLIWSICCCGPVKGFLTTVIHILIIAALFSAFNGIMSHVNITKIADNINTVTSFINNTARTLETIGVPMNVTHYKEIVNNVLK